MKAMHAILGSIIFSAAAMPSLALASGSQIDGKVETTAAKTSSAPSKIFGRSGFAEQATYVVDITKKQPHINVTCGETVVFTNGKEQFVWKFDVMGHRMVELAQIAPASFSDSALKIYVARNSIERS
ncbi:CzcE family metal-binding protein [Comamonas terrigena]|uniref:CzcE family metal-binding protein n=1 Tax=Comamonas terrigena TaxID=32013 RepID=UPI0028B2449B|nr:CzcE family metal-binding protein [Comamonas terrigena]